MADSTKYPVLKRLCTLCDGNGWMGNADGALVRCRATHGDDGLVAIACDCESDAVHERDGLGSRCDDCAPDGCAICFTWGRPGCRVHRVVISAFPGHLGDEAVSTHQGWHPLFQGPAPSEREDSPTLELPILSDAEVA